MPSNSSLKKEVQTLQDARAKDAERIAELEARLKEKEDYIPHRLAIKMANAGYVGGGDDSHLSEIRKCARAKDKIKKERKKFINGLTRTRRRCWKPITYTGSPIEVENSAKPSVLKKNKIKIKYKNGEWTKYVVKEVNRLEDMAKKLKPPKKTYSNETIYIERSQYHMDKIKEKDNLIEEKNKEIKRKNEEMSIMKEQLKEINRKGWKLYDILNGETYAGRMYDIKERAEGILTCLGHNIYLPYCFGEIKRMHSAKLICRGDTTSWSSWKLKTKQDEK
tara:strand:+ start:181 stop:1014 length:834 start_codon:yes stop_codon:yes gene_type:complete